MLRRRKGKGTSKPSVTAAALYDKSTGIPKSKFAITAMSKSAAVVSEVEEGKAPIHSPHTNRKRKAVSKPLIGSEEDEWELEEVPKVHKMQKMRQVQVPVTDKAGATSTRMSQPRKTSSGSDEDESEVEEQPDKRKLPTRWQVLGTTSTGVPKPKAHAAMKTSSKRQRELSEDGPKIAETNYYVNDDMDPPNAVFYSSRPKHQKTADNKTTGPVNYLVNEDVDPPSFDRHTKRARTASVVDDSTGSSDEYIPTESEDNAKIANAGSAEVSRGRDMTRGPRPRTRSMSKGKACSVRPPNKARGALDGQPS